MTIDDKLKHIENALRKVQSIYFLDDEFKSTGNVIDFTPEEKAATEAALEIAAGICTLFEGRP